MHLAHRISGFFFPELRWMSDTTQGHTENGATPGSGRQIGHIQGHVFAKVQKNRRPLVLCKSYTLAKKTSRVSVVSDEVTPPGLNVSIGDDHSKCSCFSGNKAKITTFTVLLLKKQSERRGCCTSSLSHFSNLAFDLLTVYSQPPINLLQCV